MISRMLPLRTALSSFPFILFPSLKPPAQQNNVYMHMWHGQSKEKKKLCISRILMRTLWELYTM